MDSFITVSIEILKTRKETTAPAKRDFIPDLLQRRNEPTSYNIPYFVTKVVHEFYVNLSDNILVE